MNKAERKGGWGHVSISGRGQSICQDVMRHSAYEYAPYSVCLSRATLHAHPPCSVPWGWPVQNTSLGLPCLPASNWVQPMSYTRWRMEGSGSQSSDKCTPSSLPAGQQRPQPHLLKMTHLTLILGTAPSHCPSGLEVVMTFHSCFP